MQFWCVFLLALGVVSGSSIVIRSNDDSEANQWRQNLVGTTQFRQLGFSQDDDPNAWRKQRIFGAVDDDPNNWRNQRSITFPNLRELPVFRLFNRKDKKPKTGPDSEDDKGQGGRLFGVYGDGEEEGVVGCAPGFEKCIPRLGR